MGAYTPVVKIKQALNPMADEEEWI